MEHSPQNPKYLQYVTITKDILMLQLNANSKILLAYIESFYNKPDKVFNASNSFIARELVMHDRTVKRCLKELEEKKLIKIEKITHKWSKSNRIIYSTRREEIKNALEEFKKKYGA